ncbi:MAG: hypothetical protein U0X92_13295 [Anaerolineales bacterium]
MQRWIKRFDSSSKPKRILADSPALGIACFGLSTTLPASPTFGFASSQRQNPTGQFQCHRQDAIRIRHSRAFDTDVNGAAFGEWT